MQFDETKFKEQLLSNPKIENRYDNIKAEIEKRHVVMLEKKPSFFERLNEITSSRAFKYSLATCGGLVLVAGVTLGILLPQLGGVPDIPDVKSAPIFLGVTLKEVAADEISYSNKLNYVEELTETDNDITLDKDTVIILDLAFDNPDEFEIDSFVVSEKEGGDKTYTTADYLEESNFNHIYVNVGKMEEKELNFKIQNITYLDGGAQRPVTMKGDNTLVVSPTPLPPPIEEHEYAISLENSEIYIDSASFSFDINYEYNMLQNMKATLYKEGDPNSGDLIYAGNNNQRFWYGINLGLDWKGIDFSAFLQGVGKWQCINGTYAGGGEVWKQASEYFYHNTWAPDRPNAEYPRLTQDGGIHGYNYQMSNAPYKLFNNRYLRLKEIQIGYTLPKTLTKKFGVEVLRVYATGMNLFEFDNLPKGFDPEAPYTENLIPFSRTYSIGVNVQF